MKSINVITLGVIVLAAVLFVGCAASQKQTAATGAHPKFESMCSKCHTVERVKAMHDILKPQEMRTVVERMARKPGSGIDLNDINDIVREMY